MLSETNNNIEVFVAITRHNRNISRNAIIKYTNTNLIFCDKS